MKLKAIEINQIGQKIYTTSININDLAKIAYIPILKSEIDEWKPDSITEYQRKPTIKRFVKIADYVVNESSVMPPAIIASYRGKLSTEKATPGSSIVEITLSDKDKLWIVDGQHRLGGLKLAAGIPDETTNRKHLNKYKNHWSKFKNYEVPVIILEAKEIHVEAKAFADINTKAQKVDKFLAALALLLDRNNKLKSNDAWLVRSADAVSYLSYSKDSVLYKKVKHPNSTGKTNTYFCTAKALQNYLKYIMNNKFYSELWDKGVEERLKLYTMIKDYWGALKDEMPFCFDEFKDYALFTNAGICVIMNCLIPIINKVGKKYPDRNQFRNIISQFGKFKSQEYWHKNSSVGPIRCIGEAQFAVESKKLVSAIESI
jgi:DGQHR domain-containing protein